MSKCNLPTSEMFRGAPGNTTSTSEHFGVGRVSVTGALLGHHLLEDCVDCDRLVRSKTRPFFRNSVPTIPAVVFRLRVLRTLPIRPVGLRPWAYKQEGHTKGVVVVFTVLVI